MTEYIRLPVKHHKKFFFIFRSWISPGGMESPLAVLSAAAHYVEQMEQLKVPNSKINPHAVGI